MNFVDLERELLTVKHEGVTYTKEIFKNVTTITGVTDEAYPAYNPATGYTTGQFCIVPELKSIYRSTATDTNTGNFPPAGNGWEWHSYINSINMCAQDENIGAKTVGTDITMTLEFNQMNILAFVDITFDSAVITQTCNITNEETVIEINGADISFTDFAEYCFKSVKKRRKVIIDLEWLPDSTVTIQFAGTVSIGTIGKGRIEELALNIVGNQLDWESKAKFLVNEITGYRTVLRFGKVRVLEAELIVTTKDFDPTAMRIDEIFDRYMLWIPTKLDIFTEAIDIAYLEAIGMKLNDQTIPTNCRFVGVPR